MSVSKNRQHKSGFTLVEVIVVAVIVAVLAAIAIPVYNGFVRDARQDAVDNLAQTAAAAANTYYRKTGSDPESPIENNTLPLNVFFDPNKFTITVTGNKIRVEMVGHSGISKEVAYK